MLFTWDTENLCIVFRQWRVTSTPSLFISLVAVILLGIGYEALRSVSRRYELSLDKQIETLPSEFLCLFPMPYRCYRLGEAQAQSASCPPRRLAKGPR